MQSAGKRVSKRRIKQTETDDDFYIPVGSASAKNKPINSKQTSATNTIPLNSSFNKKVNNSETKIVNSNTKLKKITKKFIENNDIFHIQIDKHKKATLELPPSITVESPNFLLEWPNFFDTVVTLILEDNSDGCNFKKAVELIAGALLSLKRKSRQAVDNKTNWNLSNDSIKYITSSCLLLARIFPQLFLHPAIIYELSSWLACNAMHTTKFRNFSINSNYLAVYASNLLYISLYHQVSWPPFLLKLLLDDIDRVWSYNLYTVDFVVQLITGFQTCLPSPECYLNLVGMIDSTIQKSSTNLLDYGGTDDDRYFVELCKSYRIHVIGDNKLHHESTEIITNRFFSIGDEWRHDNELQILYELIKEASLNALNSKDRANNTTNGGNNNNNNNNSNTSAISTTSTRKFLSSSGLQTITSDIALNSNKNKQFLALITLGIPEVRQTISECLDLWLNNPRSSRMAIAILVTLLECNQFNLHNQHTDTEVFSNILRMKITSGDMVNLVASAICNQILSNSSEIMITMLHVICSNEITGICTTDSTVDFTNLNVNSTKVPLSSSSSLYMSIKVMHLVYDVQPQLLNEFLPVVWHHQLMSCKSIISTNHIYQNLIGLFLKLTSHQNFEIVPFIISLLELIKSTSSSDSTKHMTENESPLINDIDDNCSIVCKDQDSVYGISNENSISIDCMDKKNSIVCDGTVLEMIVDQFVFYMLCQTIQLIQSIIPLEEIKENNIHLSLFFSTIFSQIYSQNGISIGYNMSEVQCLILEFLKLPLIFDSPQQKKCDLPNNDTLNSKVILKSLVEKLLFVNQDSSHSTSVYNMLKESVKHEKYIQLAMFVLALNMFFYSIEATSTSPSIYPVFDGLYELSLYSDSLLTLFVPLLCNLMKIFLAVFNDCGCVATDYPHISKAMDDFGNFILDGEYIAKIIEGSCFDTEFNNEQYKSFEKCHMTIASLGFRLNFIRHKNYWDLQYLLLIMSLSFPCSIGEHIWLMFKESRGLIVDYLTDTYDMDSLNYNEKNESVELLNKTIIPYSNLSYFKQLVSLCEKHDLLVPYVFKNSIKSINEDIFTEDIVYYVDDFGSNSFGLPLCEIKRFKSLGVECDIRRRLCECKEPNYLSEFLCNLYNFKPFESFEEFKFSLSFLPRYVDKNVKQLTTLCLASLIYYLLVSDSDSNLYFQDNLSSNKLVYDVLVLAIIKKIERCYLLDVVSCIDKQLTVSELDCGIKDNNLAMLLYDIFKIPIDIIKKKLIEVTCCIFMHTSQYISDCRNDLFDAKTSIDVNVVNLLFGVSITAVFDYLTYLLDLSMFTVDCNQALIVLCIILILFDQYQIEIASKCEIIYKFCDFLGRRFTLVCSLVTKLAFDFANLLISTIQLIVNNLNDIVCVELSNVGTISQKKILLSYLTIFKVFEIWNKLDSFCVINVDSVDRCFYMMEEFFEKMTTMDIPSGFARELIETTDIIHIIPTLSSTSKPLKFFLRMIQTGNQLDLKDQLHVISDMLWYSYNTLLYHIELIVDFIESCLELIINTISFNIDEYRIILIDIYDFLFLYGEKLSLPRLNSDSLKRMFEPLSLFSNLNGDNLLLHDGDAGNIDNIEEMLDTSKTSFNLETSLEDSTLLSQVFTMYDVESLSLNDIASLPLSAGETESFNVDGINISLCCGSSRPDDISIRLKSNNSGRTNKNSLTHLLSDELSMTTINTIFSSSLLTDEIINSTQFSVVNRLICYNVHSLCEDNLSVQTVGSILNLYESLAVHASIWLDDDLDKHVKLVYMLKNCSNASTDKVISHCCRLLFNELVYPLKFSLSINTITPGANYDNEVVEGSNNNHQVAIHYIMGLLLQRMHFWKAIFKYYSADLFYTMLKCYLNQNYLVNNSTSCQIIEPIVSFFCINIPSLMELFIEHSKSNINMMGVKYYVCMGDCCINDFKMKKIIDNFANVLRDIPTELNSSIGVNLLHVVKMAKLSPNLFIRHCDYLVNQCVVALREFYCRYRAEFSSVHTGITRKMQEHADNDLVSFVETDVSTYGNKQISFSNNNSIIDAPNISPIQWEVFYTFLKIVSQLVDYIGGLYIPLDNDYKKSFRDLTLTIDMFQKSIRSKLKIFNTVNYSRTLNNVEFELPNSNAVCRFVEAVLNPNSIHYNITSHTTVTSCMQNNTISEIMKRRKVTILDVCLWLLSNYDSTTKQIFYDSLNNIGSVVFYTFERIVEESPDNMNELFTMLLPFIPILPQQYFVRLCKLILRYPHQFLINTDEKSNKDIFTRCILDRYSIYIEF